MQSTYWFSAAKQSVRWARRGSVNSYWLWVEEQSQILDVYYCVKFGCAGRRRFSVQFCVRSCEKRVKVRWHS